QQLDDDVPAQLGVTAAGHVVEKPPPVARVDERHERESQGPGPLETEKMRRGQVDPLDDASGVQRDEPDRREVVQVHVPVTGLLYGPLRRYELRVLGLEFVIVEREVLETARELSLQGSERA